MCDETMKLGKILDQAEVRWTLTKGSALGAARRGEMVPWEKDVDVCVPYGKECEKACAALRIAPDNCWRFDAILLIYTNKNKLSETTETIWSLISETKLDFHTCPKYFNDTGWRSQKDSVQIPMCGGTLPLDPNYEAGLEHK